MSERLPGFYLRLGDDQADNQQPLTTEIATARRDPFFPTFDGMYRPDDDTLATRGAERGLKIYDDIERDPHAYAVIQKRKNAVISRELVIEAASDSPADVAAAEWVTSELKRINIDRACLGLLDAILKGYAVGEVIWTQIKDGLIVVDKIKPKAQRRFTFDEHSQLRLLTMADMMRGEELPDRKFLVHSFGSKDGNPFGLGLGHSLFWPVWFKKKGIVFWLTFCDKFASPTAVGEYQPGTSAADQQKLLAATRALGQEAGVIIPQGMVLKLLEAARSGSVDTYERLCRYMDEQISECVLGETLTTNQGTGGSQAATTVHNDVREELTKGDADLLSEVLNETLIRWMVELAMPGANPPKVYRSFDQPEDLVARVNRDKGLFALGYRPTPEYIHETYGPGWVPAAPAAPQLPPLAGADFAEGAADQDVADEFAGQAGGKVATAMDALVGPVRKLVMEAPSLEAIRDGLLELYPKMDTAAFTETMQFALTAARLAGRYEVLDGR